MQKSAKNGVEKGMAHGSEHKCRLTLPIGHSHPSLASNPDVGHPSLPVPPHVFPLHRDELRIVSLGRIGWELPRDTPGGSRSARDFHGGAIPSSRMDENFTRVWERKLRG